MLNAVFVRDAVVVYEDVYGGYHVAVPYGVEQKYVDLLNMMKVKIVNPEEALRDVVERVLEEEQCDATVVQVLEGFKNRILERVLSEPEVTYYTDVIELDDNGMPSRGFYVTSGGEMVHEIVIKDRRLLDLVARLVVELQGFEVANWDQMMRTLKALAGKFYIDREVIDEQYGRDRVFVDMSPLPEFMMCFHVVMYFKGFKATVEGGDLVFKKGVLALDYQFIMASPDVWELIEKNMDKLFP